MGVGGRSFAAMVLTMVYEERSDRVAPGPGGRRPFSAAPDDSCHRQVTTDDVRHDR
jgi:hypothetical protein